MVDFQGILGSVLHPVDTQTTGKNDDTAQSQDSSAKDTPASRLSGVREVLKQSVRESGNFLGEFSYSSTGKFHERVRKLKPRNSSCPPASSSFIFGCFFTLRRRCHVSRQWGVVSESTTANHCNDQPAAAAPATATAATAGNANPAAAQSAPGSPIRMLSRIRSLSIGLSSRFKLGQPQRSEEH